MSVLILAPEQLTLLEKVASKPRRNLDLGRLALGKVIGEAMRSECPVPGKDWDKLLSVYLRPGEFVASHRHRRHLIMFYPKATESLLIEGKPHLIEPGEILYVPPQTLHEVKPVHHTRLSVAMLVSDGV